MAMHAIMQNPVAAGESSKSRTEPHQSVAQIPQYSLRKILLVWAAAALPMGLLGWVVAPALAHNPQSPGFERQAVLTIGLVWQFLLVMLLLYQEAGNLRWSTIRQRLWLQTPRSPRMGKPRGRLWWWVIPFILLTALFDLQFKGIVDHLWVSVFPMLAEPRGFDLGSALATPAAKAQLAGAWNVWGLFVVSALFNSFVGEELLFRGLLLPRMAGVFGKQDWVMNGLLFGLYHLHQPWGILSSAIVGIVAMRYRAALSAARGLESLPIQGKVSSWRFSSWGWCCDWRRVGETSRLGSQ